MSFCSAVSCPGGALPSQERFSMINAFRLPGSKVCASRQAAPVVTVCFFPNTRELMASASAISEPASLLCP